MTKKLTGKVAVVTGASKGIGARDCQASGGRGGGRGRELQLQQRRGGARRARDRQQGRARPSRCRRTWQSRRTSSACSPRRRKTFGRLDILVNNAGIYEFSPLEERHGGALPQAVRPERAGPAPGDARRRSSTSAPPAAASSTSARSPARCALPNASVYSATKAAVDAITRSLAKELGPRKIRVNAINPGMVETEGVHAAGIAESDFRKQIEAQTPLGRIGQPQDIAPAAVFLASADAAWITGETLHIAGGLR